MSARVDKTWKAKGLSGFSTEAILGTLNHYGITIDEAGFKAVAGEKYPLEIAGNWRGQWKGTGPFQQFPFAAANELSARYFPDRLTPMQLAATLIDATAEAARLVDGGASQVDQRLDALEAKKTALPPSGPRRDAFNGELVGFLDRFAEAFNAMPLALAKGGHKAQALRFAGVHEMLFPDREGAVTALVEAATGDRAAAVAKLQGRAGDGAVDLFARYAALDSLYQLEADDACAATGLGIFDEAAKTEHWTLADTIAHLLANVVQRSKASDQAFTAEVVARLSRAHDATGGHGHHH